MSMDELNNYFFFYKLWHNLLVSLLEVEWNKKNKGVWTYNENMVLELTLEQHGLNCMDPLISIFFFQQIPTYTVLDP